MTDEEWENLRPVRSKIFLILNDLLEGRSDKDKAIDALMHLYWQLGEETIGEKERVGLDPIPNIPTRNNLRAEQLERLRRQLTVPIDPHGDLVDEVTNRLPPDALNKTFDLEK